MDFNSLTKNEQKVLKQALVEYWKRVERQEKNIFIMSEKQFNYGDVVIKKGASRVDSWFGLEDGDIGVIVGHYDCDGLDGDGRDMYRVYYSESSGYIGTNAEAIDLYEGIVPDHLKNVEWNQIWELRVKLK
jgi:hypothetical protein